MVLGYGWWATPVVPLGSRGLCLLQDPSIRMPAHEKLAPMITGPISRHRRPGAATAGQEAAAIARQGSILLIAAPEGSRNVMLGAPSSFTSSINRGRPDGS